MSQENAVPASVLPAGTTLQMGKYRVVRFIASGGFGNTYEVLNVEFDERMAMKEFFMRGVNERDGDSVSVSVSNAENRPQFEVQKEKLKKEARRLRKLHNSNIVKVHDLFEENSTVYYVMDYIDGMSLSERLKRMGKPLQEAEVRSILPQLLKALDEVHRSGIWHLDIKPANIMVDSHGKALLIDFGASKQLRSSENFSVSTSTAMCYTPGYAPLEQIERDFEKFGPWTDFYALGATLYSLLTTKKPPTTSEIAEGDAFDFPPSVSPRMRQLVEWLMQPARRKRPQTVGEINDFIKETSAGIEDDESTLYMEQAKKKERREQAKAEKPGGDTAGKIGRAKIGLLVGATVCVLMGAPYLYKRCDSTEVPMTAVDSTGGNKGGMTAGQKQRVIDNLVNNMIYVPGGTFTMFAILRFGSDVDVTLSSYYIGKYEVTQAEWKAVMGSNPSYFKGDNLPVESVSWDDCQTFIRKLNALTGKNFRLPTKAEWEFAARGGNSGRGYKYSGSNDIGAVAWYDENSGNQTHPVGQKSPNELGIYDMSGNVWEWSQDWYDNYPPSTQTNPVGPESGSNRVIRGGSWFSRVGRCHVLLGSYYAPDDCKNDIGLRLVL